jgi:hypothetical protein
VGVSEARGKQAPARRQEQTMNATATKTVTAPSASAVAPSRCGRTTLAACAVQWRWGG